MNFDQAFNKLLINEGKLSLDPNDRGNWTSGRVGVGELKGSKYGISAMSYPTLDIANLTEAQAKAIYLKDFWGRADELPDAIRFDFFDAAVNSGYRKAVRWLQQAVGAEQDGVIGIKTLTAVRMQDPQKLSKIFTGIRLNAMTEMNVWVTQGRGWARRIARNLMDS